MIYTKELAGIEENIEILMESIEDEFTKKETKRLISSGGKRLRPLFLILAAKAGTINKKCYEAAASLELLHTSSLIHDDIIDHGEMRRSRETTVNIYGREKAVSVGGILSFFAMDKIISLGSEKASAAMIDTLETLCLGELKQLDERYNFEIDYCDYITRISGKTASLFALSCIMGGILSGVTEDMIKKLYNIGFNIGCSFQILDDILDITGLEKETGKVCGQDIQGGIITLPYLLLMGKDSAFKKKILSVTYKSQKPEFDELTSEVRKSSALEETYGVSNLFLDKALEVLSSLDSPEVEEKFTYIIKKLYRM
ncbi:polyprenyl synthetase family protein [Psychrilyobacter atlanticus]|uniref:polyprenyl synthetase family protein n=1 Tax=Psychrilyobacter atlanticus TaxID=271091 RepID=UPI0004288678|nr:polyprenyl synthetase family protein [Psychrilyobacter atlanticus]